MLYAGYISSKERERWHQVRKIKTPSLVTPDQITNPGIYVGVWAMYRKVVGYLGPIWKIRRASDNVELDCNTLAAAVAHIGGSTGYVTKWYDQSGNGRDAYETNSTWCPIFNATDADLVGGLPSLNTADRGMQFTGASGQWGSNPIITVGYKQRSSSGGSRVLTGDNNWLIGPYSGTHNLHDGGFAGGVTAVVGQEVIASTWRESGSASKFRVNGVFRGQTGGSGPGTNMYLGHYGNFGTESGNSNIFELMWRNPGTATVVADVAAVEAKMNLKYLVF